MANAIPPRRPPRQPKAEHLCMAYPVAPEIEHKSYWLAVYLQDLAEYAAMDALAAKFNAFKGIKTDRITQLASYSATNLLQEKLWGSARYTQEEGLLLYAWPGTTYFDQPTARQ
ncbi:hypothetical protein [Delftia tsuruhatensis]|uniref:hypothetical protein n=1 Tax=Delftia tsuruhatensis TaxID=180282 RepID=UPI0020909F7D|nr:hypothetical protein [Delftia tsuruhatensis]MCO5338277.1 hypothetical protein [Delftia tsuruhatensis]MCR4545675.1 hypothetical protein [Delftia tsuruhatensis]